MMAMLVLVLWMIMPWKMVRRTLGGEGRRDIGDSCA